jgi:hypothetical protein
MISIQINLNALNDSKNKYNPFEKMQSIRKTSQIYFYVESSSSYIYYLQDAKPFYGWLVEFL